jgi:HSP20 family protein
MFDLDTFYGMKWKDRIGSDEMQFMDSGPAQWHITIRSPLWRPPTDVFETEEKIIVRVEIAGMREQDFILELDGRMLSIRGVRPDVSARRAYHQMEIRFGEFSIEIELPVAVVAQQVEAVYENGFLLVSLPKARPLQIRIEDRE